MSESGFASLGPTLLARKGGAKPAMRPQLGPAISDPAEVAKLAEEQLEDLGWNDMGDDDADDAGDYAADNVVIPIGRDTPFDTQAGSSSPIVRRQQRRLEERVLADAVMTGPEESLADDNQDVAPDRYDATCDEAYDEAYDDGFDEACEAGYDEDSFDTQQSAQRANTLPEVLQLKSLPTTTPSAAPPDAAPVRSISKGSADKTRRAAFTLRLDPDRHLKLRLAATIKGVSAQVLVTEALDALLAEFDELDGIAARMQRH